MDGFTHGRRVVLSRRLWYGSGAGQRNPDEASGGEAAFSATDATYGLAAPAAAIAAAAENVDSIIKGVLVKDAKGTVIDAVYNPANQQRSKLGDASASNTNGSCRMDMATQTAAHLNSKSLRNLKFSTR
ncbi:hypothetical protein HMSSN036_84800 [Paenibacillus macerans]|nr:hypothetical protein HMSSN036_84800 [Paenibacillus macerans]